MVGAFTRLVQPLKVAFIIVTLAGIASTPIRLEQPLKASCIVSPRKATLELISQFVIVVLALNVEKEFTITGCPLITFGILGEVEIFAPTQFEIRVAEAFVVKV
jgi:hypothetical protein